MNSILIKKKYKINFKFRLIINNKIRDVSSNDKNDSIDDDILENDDDVIDNREVYERLEKVMASRHKVYLKKCCQNNLIELGIKYISYFKYCDVKLYSYMIKQCFKYKDNKNVLKIIEYRMQRGIPNDQYMYSAHISACGKLKDIKKAVSCFEASVEHNCDTLYVYNAMLDAYGKNHDITGAERLWRALCMKYEPDAISYAGMIRALGNEGQIDKIKLLVGEMMEKDVALMPHLFTIIYDTFYKLSEIKEENVAWLLSLIDMAREHVEMNEHIMSSMVTCMSYYQLSLFEKNRIYSEFLKYTEEKKVSLTVLTAMMSFCTRQRLYEKTLEIWNIMKKENINPDDYILSSALSACSHTTNNNESMMNLVSIISKEIYRMWNNYSNNTHGSYNNNNLKSLSIALNALIKAYGWKGDIDEAYAIYKKMKDIGPTPDNFTYNTMMSIFASKSFTFTFTFNN